MVSRRRFLFSAAATAPVTAHALWAQGKPAAPSAPEAAACDAPLPKPVLALKDRRGDIVPISKQEREGRLDLARELMKQYGMNAILITTGSSLLYFTGANWWQSERLFAYVLPQAAAPFVVCPFFERDRLAELLLQFPERETTLTYLWEENEDPYAILKRALAETGMAAGTIGIEEHTQFAFANAIAAAAPAVKFVSATPVTAGCRSLKSPAEIALLRLANQITFDVYKAAYLSCAPGDTNRKFEAMVEAGYKRSGVRGEVSCNVGPASGTPHGSPAEQVIRERELVVIDDGCQVDGYWSDITRSFVYGVPTDQQRMIFETVHNAQSAALAAARPDVEMQAVDAAARKVVADAGFGPGFQSFAHRLGHGIGLDMHEWPYLVGGNKQKLMPGMVFSNEPGIYLPGKFGIRLEDDMLITETGAELFTTQSPSLQDPFAIPAELPAKKNAAPGEQSTPEVQPAAEKPGSKPETAAPEKKDATPQG